LQNESHGRWAEEAPAVFAELQDSEIAMSTAAPQPAAPQPERRAFQYSLRTLFIVTTVIALLLGLIVWYLNSMHAFFHGFVAGAPRAIESPEDWPRTLKELVTDAKQANVVVQGLEVQCMCRGWETEYIWRMQVTPGLVAFITARWKLSATTWPSDGVFCGASHLSGDRTPAWWSPQEGGKTAYFVCNRSRASEFGDHFQVGIDEDRQVIFVRYYEKW